MQIGDRAGRDFQRSHTDPVHENRVLVRWHLAPRKRGDWGCSLSSLSSLSSYSDLPSQAVGGKGVSAALAGWYTACTDRIGIRYGPHCGHLGTRASGPRRV